MEILAKSLLAVYVLASFLLIIISLNCYVMVYLFKKRLKAKRRETEEAYQTFKDSGKDYPAVTTQVAIFNELNVADRIIRAVADMEYPEGKHFIQVLDDSIDETRELTRETVAELKSKGVQIELLQRTDRKGYKAGALDEALKSCKTDYVAIFDADFLPPKDYLLKAMPHFMSGDKTGLVQCRWGHLNRNNSLITRVQALGIDGHFAVEQSARDWNDLYMNFNGTAGIMAVQAIKDAGGWEADTLTEDMDLSYRIQIAGWETRYLLDLECPAEVPEDINSFKSQQFRWAKGSMQTALKIIPRVFRDNVRPFKKIQAVLHMTHYLIHPLMLTLAILAWPVAVMNEFSFGPLNIGWINLTVLLCCTAPTVLYWTSQRALKKDWLKNFSVYPALMFTGCGLCLSNSRAVFEALTGKVSGFVRTPKKGDTEKKHYEVKLPVIPFLEIALGLYCILTLKAFLLAGHWIGGLFVLLYSFGFLFIGILALIHSGFFKELGYELMRPYALLTALTIVSAWGCSSSEAGSLHFALFYVFLGALSLLLWKMAPQKFTGAHWFILLIAAAGVRLIFFQFNESDDIYRYIWEGRVLNAGFDPYILAPDSEALAGMRDGLWEGINHKSWSAIYGPLALLVFKFTTSVSATVFFMKSVFVYLDLATLGVIIAILKHKGHHPGALALYAFNPLILMTFAGEGHLDSLQMLLVVTAYYFCIRKKWARSAVFIGLAVSAKFTAILFVPFLIRRENWRWIFVAAAAAVLPALFFEANVQQMFSSLIQFGAEMRFNDSAHYVLWKIFGTGTAAVICAGILILLSAGIWLTQDSPLRGAFFCCFAFLLMAPTVHYWYLCMLIPFLVFVPSVPAMVWTMSSVFYFNVMWRKATGEGFTHSLPDQFWQYVPVYLSILIVLILKVRGKSAENLDNRKLPLVSVLIPVLNEADNAKDIMNRLKNQTVKAEEIIVIDGGSADNSVELFEKAGAKTIKCPQKGRGNQLAAGLKIAGGEAVLILHADMIPDNRVVERVATALAKDPHLIGGALGARFQSDLFKYKVITFLNLVRVALTGISFGDQGQFFRRKEAVEAECLREIPLMEDVELGMRLQALGKTRLLDGGLEVSVRRWEKKKVLGNALHIFLLLSRYLFLRRTRSSVKVDKFYNEYYADKTTETV